jgi:hypothetical protein
MIGDDPHGQNALNLILPIKPGRGPVLRQLLTPTKDQIDGQPNAQPGSLTSSAKARLDEALKALANVHFAQFVFLDNDTRLAVLTIFDGPFDEYIQSFVERIGLGFNLILDHIDGGDAVVPVQLHKDAFLAFIHAHHREGLGVFSAYPGKRVFDIAKA